MVRTFQLTKALSGMTVLENMRLGATKQGGENIFVSLFKPLWKAKEDEITERAMQLLARFKLDTKNDDYAVEPVRRPEASCSRWHARS